jgi:alkylation response protein AidB-like acyl-CoA dehydrogenase
MNWIDDKPDKTDESEKGKDFVLGREAGEKLREILDEVPEEVMEEAEARAKKIEEEATQIAKTIPAVEIYDEFVKYFTALILLSGNLEEAVEGLNGVSSLIMSCPIEAFLRISEKEGIPEIQKKLMKEKEEEEDETSE